MMMIKFFAVNDEGSQGKSRVGCDDDDGDAEVIEENDSA